MSVAVWLPTAWMLIAGSRPLAAWFGPSGLPVDETIEAGSPLDRLVLAALMAVALMVCVKRRISWNKLGKDNVWLLVLLLYMGASVLWSDFPVVSFKRWVRALGPALMAVVILTERRPLQAFEAVFRRAAYMLVPLSLVLVRYYPQLGREYDKYGHVMWTGVALQKNGLGQVCAVSVLVLFWMALKSWLARGTDRSRVQWTTDLIIVAVAMYLLRGPVGSYSATSIAILAIGSAILAVLRKFDNLARLIIKHLKQLILLVAAAYWLFAQSLISLIAPVLGRDETLTGRTHIWDALFKIASRSPFVGVGYGGFLGLQSVAAFQSLGGGSHNGYLSVYLELGVIGLMLLAAFLLALCGKARKILDESSDLSILVVCVLAVTLLYNLSESAFLKSGFLWTTTVFLAVLSSSANALSGHSPKRGHTSVAHRRTVVTVRPPNARRIGPQRAGDRLRSMR